MAYFFQVEVLIKSGLWKVVKQAVQYLSGFDEWYPYDVSMNIIHSFHHTRIHEDCETYEVQYLSRILKDFPRILKDFPRILQDFCKNLKDPCNDLIPEVS